MFSQDEIFKNISQEKNFKIFSSGKIVKESLLELQTCLFGSGILTEDVISLSLDKRRDTPIAQARLWCSFCKIYVVTLSAGSAFSAFLSHLIFVLVLFPLFPGGKFPPPSVHCQPLRLLILLWS